MISYDKLWQTMQKRGITKYALIKNVTSATLWNISTITNKQPPRAYINCGRFYIYKKCMPPLILF